MRNVLEWLALLAKVRVSLTDAQALYLREAALGTLEWFGLIEDRDRT